MLTAAPIAAAADREDDRNKGDRAAPEGVTGLAGGKPLEPDPPANIPPYPDGRLLLQPAPAAAAEPCALVPCAAAACSDATPAPCGNGGRPQLLLLAAPGVGDCPPAAGLAGENRPTEPWEDVRWCSCSCGCWPGLLLLLLLTGLKPRCTTVGPLTSLLLQLWRTRGWWCSWLDCRRAKGPVCVHGEPSKAGKGYLLHYQGPTGRHIALVQQLQSFWHL
jgi:hypothetical protein